MKDKIRMLPLEVLRPHYHDASNGGITSKYDQVLVICDQGPIVRDSDDMPENAVRITRTGPGGAGAALTPVTPPDDDRTLGPMSGGCFATTSDSRWRILLRDTLGKCAETTLALPIHDRYETPAQNRALSH